MTDSSLQDSQNGSLWLNYGVLAFDWAYVGTSLPVERRIRRIIPHARYPARVEAVFETARCSPASHELIGSVRFTCRFSLAISSEQNKPNQQEKPAAGRGPFEIY